MNYIPEQLIEILKTPCSNGDKYWYLNGQRHRVDGPALVRANGNKFWYLNGEEHPEEEFNIYLANYTSR